MIKYEENKIKQIVSLLNGIRVTGIEQARRMSMIAALLDEGKKEDEDGVREHS